MKKQPLILRKLMMLSLGNFLTVSSLLAQTDSLKLTQESGTFQAQTFVSAADYVFMTRQEAKWLLKVNYGSMLSGRSLLNDFEYTLEAGGEAKLNASFSINGAVGYNHKSEQLIRGFWYGQIEPRWYYNMAKRIAQGKSANNFSGNYFSFKYTQFTRPNTSQLDRTTILPQQRLMLALGTQKRMFNHGFFDFSFNAGWQRDIDRMPNYSQLPGVNRIDSWSETAQTGFVARSEIRLGLALGGEKQKTNLPACEIFKCFDETKSMFKIDMNKLFYIAPNNVNVSLSTAYERKIKESAWSLNQELRIDYNYRFERYVYPVASTITTESNGLAFRYVLEPRYYYNLKKRIREGKSANNLSANYVALHNYNRVYHTFLKFRPETAINRTQFVTAIGAVWGIQRRLFTNGFFDGKIGLVRKLNEQFHDFLIDGVEPVLDLKIGFAF